MILFRFCKSATNATILDDKVSENNPKNQVF